MEIEKNNRILDGWDESRRNKRLNYAKTSFTELRKFFSDINLHELKETNDVREKCDLFLQNIKFKEYRNVIKCALTFSVKVWGKK